MTDPEMPENFHTFKFDLPDTPPIVFPEGLFRSLEESIACIDGRADGRIGVNKAPEIEAELAVEQQVAKDFVEATEQMFEAEHTLLEPPKPRIRDHLYEKLVYKIEPERYYSLPDNDEVFVPPTLEEQIDNARSNADFDIKFERMSGNLRTRENFGQEFRIATKFDLETSTNSYTRKHQRDAGEEVEPVKHDPFETTGLANRVSLYRYLQQRGLVLIDDTGLSAYANEATQHTDHRHGFLFLPESIDKEQFYAFEDEVRAVVPFSRNEVRLRILETERDEGVKMAPEDLVVEDRDMRELVDYLATDERYMSMFEQTDALQAARRSQRRTII